MKKQKLRFEGFFEVDLTDEWIHEEDKGTVSIYKPDGYGAITISVYRAPHELNAREILIYILGTHKIRYGANDIKTKGNSTYIKVKNPKHLKYKYWIFCINVLNNRHLYLTYNSDNYSELGEAKDIILSAKILNNDHS